MNILKTPVLIFGGGYKNLEWFNYLFSDLSNSKTVNISSTDFCPCCENIFFRILAKIFLGKKVGKLLQKTYLYTFFLNVICKVIQKKFPNGSLCIFHHSNKLTYNTFFLTKLRNINTNNKLVYWFTDLYSNVSTRERSKNVLEICASFYDLTITYDPTDADKYNFKYIETPYSIKQSKTTHKNNIDLLYIGKAKLKENKERYERIIKIHEKAIQKKLKTDFYIVDVPKQLQIKRNGLHYINFISYKKIVKKIRNCKCILEVSQLDETGTTLRLFEAISFDKKLLFTNPSMQKHNYYNQNNMKFIDCTNLNNIDVDIDFISQPVIPDNNIKQLLSPEMFIIKIFEELKKINMENIHG